MKIIIPEDTPQTSPGTILDQNFFPQIWFQEIATIAKKGPRHNTKKQKKISQKEAF